MKTRILLLCAMCFVSLCGCNKNSLKPIINNNVTRIEFYYTLSYIPEDWEEIERLRIENEDDISQIVNAINVNSLKRNSALLDSNIKMRFVYADGEDTWVNYHVDRKRKEVYGREWVSVELYDIFVEIGIIGPLKKMSIGDDKVTDFSQGEKSVVVCETGKRIPNLV